MSRYQKIDFNKSGVGFIDSNGFNFIKKKPYRKPIYKILPKYSTWFIKLKLKYPAPKPRKRGRMSITEYANKIGING